MQKRTTPIPGQAMESSIRYHHVRYWHKADIGLRGLNVSCEGKAGFGAFGLLGGAGIGLSVSNYFRIDSLGLPSLAFIVSGDLEHPGADLRIAK